MRQRQGEHPKRGCPERRVHPDKLPSVDIEQSKGKLNMTVRFRRVLLKYVEGCDASFACIRKCSARPR
jgi:hypothetical protein